MSEDIVAYTPANSNPLIPTHTIETPHGSFTGAFGEDIYEFLQVKAQLSKWITRKIEQLDLTENIDYYRQELAPQVSVEGANSSVVKNDYGANASRNAAGLFTPTTRFFFSLSAAKQIGMVTHTKRGGQVRQYFLWCEQQVLAKEAPQLPVPPPESALALPSLLERLQEHLEVAKLLGAPADIARREAAALIKQEYGRDYTAMVGFVKRPDPKKCKSIIDLLDKKRYMHPSRLWRTWLVNLDIIYPLDSYDAVPELTPSGKEIAYIDWLDSVVGLPKPDIKMDEEAFERLHSTSLPNGRVYNDNHGW